MRRTIREIITLVIALATSLGSFVYGMIEALPQTPQSALGWFVVAYISLIAAAIIYSYRLRMMVQNLEERLKPKLEIAGVGTTSKGWYRINVRNLTNGSLSFEAQIDRIAPQRFQHPFPSPLHATHHSGEGQPMIIGNGCRDVDIFTDEGLNLMLLTSTEPRLAKDERYEIIVCVSPSVVGGIACRRRFYIIPQSDGSVKWTDGGQVL
jgi:hypothetical protein